MRWSGLVWFGLQVGGLTVPVIFSHEKERAQRAFQGSPSKYRQYLQGLKPFISSTKAERVVRCLLSYYYYKGPIGGLLQFPSDRSLAAAAPLLASIRSQVSPGLFQARLPQRLVLTHF